MKKSRKPIRRIKIPSKSSHKASKTMKHKKVSFVDKLVDLFHTNPLKIINLQANKELNQRSR